jgi:hypothetical protein
MHPERCDSCHRAGSPIGGHRSSLSSEHDLKKLLKQRPSRRFMRQHQLAAKPGHRG